MGNNTELTDEQVTELYEKINQPKQSIVESESPPADQTAEEKRAWELAEGVKVESEDDLLNYAKQGYQLSQTKSELERQQEIVEKYKAIDEYAINNPDWWNHVQQAYSQQGQESGTIDQSDIPPELQALESKVNEIAQFINQEKAQREAQQVAEEDSKLESEINQIREQHQHINFDERDEYGMTLEQRVLKHANEIGTSSFRAAFRDYAHDTLVSKAQELGKESLTKDMARKTKLGILGVKGKSGDSVESRYSKEKSYDDLMKEALDELGIK